jgi:spectinomycin phosphotransferase
VDHAEELAEDLKVRGLEFVLCHSDIHPGNLHLAAEESLYIVDWDNPIYAPRERDLMLIGGSSTWSDPREAAHFYQGYGNAAVDRAALAYYRCERIIWDIAAFCEQILASDEGREDREQGYQWFVSNYAPGGEIELAMNSEW